LSWEGADRGWGVVVARVGLWGFAIVPPAARGGWCEWCGEVVGRECAHGEQDKVQSRHTKGRGNILQIAMNGHEADKMPSVMIFDS